MRMLITGMHNYGANAPIEFLSGLGFSDQNRNSMLEIFKFAVRAAICF